MDYAPLNETHVMEEEENYLGVPPDPTPNETWLSHHDAKAGPVDLFWAILQGWHKVQLMQWMHTMHACVTQRPTAMELGGDDEGLCDTRYLKENWMPIHTVNDGAKLVAIEDAFLLLLQAAKTPMKEDHLVVLSMRVASMIFILHDGRGRLMAMTHHEGIHDRLWVRPPQRERLARAILKHHMDQCTHRYVMEMGNLLHMPNQSKETIENAAGMWTRHIWHELSLFWDTSLPPFPPALTSFEENNKKQEFYFLGSSGCRRGQRYRS